MLQKVIQGADEGATPVTLNMKYNKGNQLTTMTGGKDKIAYSYDANGNMTNKSLTDKQYGKLTDTYAYNVLDQLTSYTGYDGYTQQLSYDANGMRTTKKEAGNANRSTLEDLLRGEIAGLPDIVEPTVLLNSDEATDIPTELEWATTEYLYDITQEYYQVIEETTSSKNSSTTTAYAYGLERIAAYTDSQTTRYVYDGRGSVAQAITAPVAGEAVSLALPDVAVKVQSFTYTAFGEQMGASKVAGFTYNAEAFDAATGMINLRARQYEPTLGRFSQKDKLGGNMLIPSSFNAYCYTHNSPVNFVDKDGMIAKSITNAFSSFGNALKSVAKTIGNGIYNDATKVLGKTVVDSVISGVTSVAKHITNAVKTAIKPATDVISNAWNDAIAIVNEAQKEIAALDKADPNYKNKVAAIMESACSRLGNDWKKTTPLDPKTFVVEGGMVLSTDKNVLRRIVLPAGKYTKSEIMQFIREYGSIEMILSTEKLLAVNTHTYTFPDGTTLTITADEGLQNIINANKETATLNAWTPSLVEEFVFHYPQYKEYISGVIDQIVLGQYSNESSIGGIGRPNCRRFYTWC